jgi:hypothetical protein
MGYPLHEKGEGFWRVSIYKEKENNILLCEILF